MIAQREWLSGVVRKRLGKVEVIGTYWRSLAHTSLTWVIDVRCDSCHSSSRSNESRRYDKMRKEDETMTYVRLEVSNESDQGVGPR